MALPMTLKLVLDKGPEYLERAEKAIKYIYDIMVIWFDRKKYEKK